MKYTKKRVIVHNPVPGKFDANGKPTTTPVTTQIKVSDVVFGDGSSTESVLQRDGKTLRTITTTLLSSGYTDASTFEIIINYGSQVFVTVDTKALGASLTGIVALIEFNDSDHPFFWIPSKESANRDAALASNEWTLTGLGSWIVASREIHKHCLKARVRFKALAGAADSGSRIYVTWHHNGHRSDGEIIGNDPLPNEVVPSNV